MNILISAFFKKENIKSGLDSLDIQENEKEKLLQTAEDLLQLRFLHIILERLDEKDKELFLEQLDAGSAEGTVSFLREKIEGVENILREHAKILENEILQDIRSLKKGEK